MTERANLAKSEFLARMSHELRTPLNAILGFAQLLELEQLSGSQRESVESIVTGGRRLLELISEVLDIARIEAGELRVSPERVALLELATEIVQLMRPLADKRQIRLETRWSPDSRRLHVIADPQAPRSGAAQSALQRGQVQRRWRHGHDRPRARGGRDDHDLVADTGPGIAPANVALLFEPFERLGAEQTATEGTGLGLALSKRLVEAMGGKLLVETAVGHGTKFRVELPLADAAEANPRTGVPGRHNSAAVDHAATGRILYIEDNVANVRLIEAIVALRPNVKLIPAMTASPGIELAREHLPELILHDLQLPDETGETVLRRLRRDPRTATTTIVIATADVTTRQIDRLMAAGADHYLAKPIDVNALLHLIDEHLSPKTTRPSFQPAPIGHPDGEMPVLP